MAEQDRTDYNTTLPRNSGSLLGGTQSGEPGHELDSDSTEGGTSNLASSSGVAQEAPKASPITNLGSRAASAIMRDGTPREEVERCLEGLSFPALKHDVIHHATHRGASEIVVAALSRIPGPSFGSAEAVLRAYGEMQTSGDKPSAMAMGR